MKKLPKANPIFPFLWVRGEDEETVVREINKIASYGLKGICVESRKGFVCKDGKREAIESDFLEESWFARFDVILREAKRHGMQIWILDDRYFPTGIANYVIRDKYPQLRQRMLRAHCVDFAGPAGKVRALTTVDTSAGERLVDAFLARRTKDGLGEISKISLLSTAEFCSVNAEAGAWRLIFLIETQVQAYSNQPYRIDMINPVSCSKLIEGVYEPYYKRYGEEFGQTIVGFFSDEPGFLNGISENWLIEDNVMYRQRLGCPGRAYPYREDLYRELTESDPYAGVWLFFGQKDRSEIAQITYMNLISKAYSACFNQQLSQWCHAHGVLYAGHVIEDEGAHCRPGCGPGHYFRSMEGADFGSVDVVLHQIKPFETEFPHIAGISGGIAHPEFFHYSLAKLASSVAHTDPIKKGRAICEIFGAYGWAESIAEMKYLFHHMVVRGINHFIPHAFSMLPQDDEAPPYFGEDSPMQAAYRLLFTYMHRVCDTLSKAKFEIRTAVLYHAEADWSGRDYVPMDVIAKELAQSQIDFDFVTFDDLERKRVEDGRLLIGNASYDVLLIPGFDFLPDFLISKLEEVDVRKLLIGPGMEISGAERVACGSIAAALSHEFVPSLATAEPDLRATKGRLDTGITFFLLFNEGNRPVNNVLHVEEGRKYVWHNFADGTSVDAEAKDGQIRLSLPPGGFAMLKEGSAPIAPKFLAEKEISDFHVRLRAVGKAEYDSEFSVGAEWDVNQSYPEFFGEIQYAFVLDKECALSVEFSAEYCRIETQNANYENINSPFCVQASAGEVKIILCNGAVHKEKDFFSRFTAWKPCVLQRVRCGKLELK